MRHSDCCSPLRTSVWLAWCVSCIYNAARELMPTWSACWLLKSTSHFFGCLLLMPQREAVLSYLSLESCLGLLAQWPGWERSVALLRWYLWRSLWGLGAAWSGSWCPRYSALESLPWLLAGRVASGIILSQVLFTTFS